MATPSTGDAAQTRLIAEQVGEAAATLAVTKFAAQHPGAVKAEIPGPLKWAAGIIAALLATGVGGTAVWLMTTVNEMQVTIARIDERMVSQSDTQESRFDEINRRLSRLEQLQAGDGR
jgi:hypothetical protein